MQVLDGELLFLISWFPLYSILNLFFQDYFQKGRAEFLLVVSDEEPPLNLVIMTTWTVIATRRFHDVSLPFQSLTTRNKSFSTDPNHHHTHHHGPY